MPQGLRQLDRSPPATQLAPNNVSVLEGLPQTHIGIRHNDLLPGAVPPLVLANLSSRYEVWVKDREYWPQPNPAAWPRHTHGMCRLPTSSPYTLRLLSYRSGRRPVKSTGFGLTLARHRTTISTAQAMNRQGIAALLILPWKDSAPSTVVASSHH